MEDCWKYIKKNPYALKNRAGFIGYGCRCRKRNKYYFVAKRRSFRDYRKYGFDISETWSLDYTISAWLSDNVGGFFRNCGSIDSWGEVDLEGNSWAIGDDLKPFIKAEEIRRESFLVNLKEFLQNGDKVIVTNFIKFVVPRLDYLSKHINGYPADFKSFLEWQNCMISMKDELLSNNFSENFIKYFFSLWD